MGWGLRRRLRKVAASLQRPASLSPDLHRDLGEARRVREDWAREALEAGSRPSLPKNLDSVRSAAARIEKIFDELAVLLEGTPAGTDLARTDLDELEQRLEALHRDREDRSEEHTSELQSRGHLVCRLLLEKKKKHNT